MARLKTVLVTGSASGPIDHVAADLPHGWAAELLAWLSSLPALALDLPGWVAAVMVGGDHGCMVGYSSWRMDKARLRPKVTRVPGRVGRGRAVLPSGPFAKNAGEVQRHSCTACK